MPQVILSANALRNLDRLQAFLGPGNPVASHRARQAIQKGLQLLADNSEIGRLIDDMPEDYREIVIDFGKSGYLAHYRFDEAADRVIVLALRHQPELDYASSGGAD